jgi:hypothetical protein
MGGYERSQVDSCLHGCSKDAPARWIRVRGPALMMAALVPLGGCSSAASRPAKGPITVATGSRSHAPTTTASLFKRAGVPQTYQQACMQEGGCAAAGPVPAKLVRPLRFPYTGHGSCRGSPGRYVATPDFVPWRSAPAPYALPSTTLATRDTASTRPRSVAGYSSLGAEHFRARWLAARGRRRVARSTAAPARERVRHRACRRRLPGSADGRPL